MFDYTQLDALRAVDEAGTFEGAARRLCFGNLKDTTVPMWIAIIWYWLVAVLLGYVFGVLLVYGASGVWFGVSIGLLGAAVTLWWRFSVLVDRKTI